MQTVLNAIEGSHGIMLTIAERLDCSWDTARTYCNKWTETKNALKIESEILLDICESKVFNAVKEGDLNTAKWVLSTKGKNRGYSKYKNLFSDFLN